MKKSTILRRIERVENGQWDWFYTELVLMP